MASRAAGICPAHRGQVGSGVSRLMQWCYACCDNYVAIYDQSAQKKWTFINFSVPSPGSTLLSTLTFANSLK